MLTAYIIGVIATPLIVGLGARTQGRTLDSNGWKMAAISLAWPVALWGCLAATVADTIANS